MRSHPSMFCNPLSGQISDLKENVSTLVLHHLAAPVCSCDLLFPCLFFFKYIQGSNGTRWEVAVKCSLYGSVTPKYKFQTHQAASEIAAYFWDPLS